MLGIARPLALVVVLVLLCAVFTTIEPTFASAANLRSMLSNMSILLVFAVGATIVLAVGQYDLSVPTMGLLTATTAFSMMGTGWPVALAVAAALAVGIAAGLLNGVLVARFGMPSLLATYAVGSVSSIPMLLFLDVDAVGLFSDLPAGFAALGRGTFLGIPVLTLWAAGVFGVAAVVWFRVGLSPPQVSYADGWAPRARECSPSQKVIASFAASGLLIAIGSLLMSVWIGSVQVGGAETQLFPAYLAAFIGTVAARNGTPNLGGTLIGAAIVAAMQKGAILAGGISSPHIGQFLLGLLAVLAALAHWSRSSRI